MQPRLPSSFERNRTRLWVGLALAILMVVLSAMASVIHLRHVAEQRAYTTIHNMARSIEQSVEGRIDTIDVVLRACADEVHRLMAEGFCVAASGVVCASLLMCKHGDSPSIAQGLGLNIESKVMPSCH